MSGGRKLLQDGRKVDPHVLALDGAVLGELEHVQHPEFQRPAFPVEAEGLARKTTTRGSLGTPLGATSTISRTKSREQTLPYSAERFQTELQEEAERQQSAIIVPQKTSDGITLVDWYTTDE